MPAHAKIKVGAFGDSLMDEYDLEDGEGFIPQLGIALTNKGWDVEMLDLAVSGDTTADGRNRLSQVLRSQPDIVLLGLGSNDALRNLHPDVAYSNLSEIITRLKAENIPILFLGAQAPLNWGMRYKKQFDAVFPQLAQEHELQFFPFILEGVALDPRYILADGLHPNPAGITIMVANIEPHVSAMLAELDN